MVHKHAHRKKLSKSQERWLADKRVDIEGMLGNTGRFTHNIVSMILREVAHKLGRKYANELVDEFSLKENLGIRKER
jgi:hypothetical protein